MALIIPEVRLKDHDGPAAYEIQYFCSCRGLRIKELDLGVMPWLSPLLTIQLRNAVEPQYH